MKQLQMPRTAFVKSGILVVTVVYLSFCISSCISFNRYIHRQRSIYTPFLPKTVTRLKYLGIMPIYLCRLGNYRNGYYTQFINHIYIHSYKTISF